MCCESFEFSLIILDVNHSLLPQVIVVLWSVTWITESEDQGTIPAMSVFLFFPLLLLLFYKPGKTSNSHITLFSMARKMDKSNSVHQ